MQINKIRFHSAITHCYNGKKLVLMEINADNNIKIELKDTLIVLDDITYVPVNNTVFFEKRKEIEIADEPLHPSPSAVGDIPKEVAERPAKRKRS